MGLCAEQCARVQMTSQRLIIMRKVSAVKSWTPQLFRNMQKAEREAMMRSLNEETRALLETANEFVPEQLGSFELKQLSNDVEACNKIYQELVKQTSKPSGSQGLSGTSSASLDRILDANIDDFMARIENAQGHLLEALRISPGSMEDVSTVVQYLEDIMTSLSAIQNEYNTLRFSPCDNSNTAQMITQLTAQWDRTWYTTQTQLSKMKLFMQLHSHMTIITCQYITRLEQTLRMQDSLPIKERALLETREKCEDLNISLAAIQPQIDVMIDLAEKLEDVLAKEADTYSSKSARMPACNDLLGEAVDTVQEIVERWANIQFQCNER